MTEIFSMAVHPAADIFPMIPKDELEELAADIKANGLIHPIVVKDNIIIDGRNRRAACEIAGITPEVTELNGQDIESYIISSNVMHRRLTKGQSAMAVAMVHREAYSKKVKSLNQSQKVMLSQARLILKHSETLAKEVMSGTTPFDRALQQVKGEIAESEKRKEKMQFLEENAPDLVSLVTEETLSLDDAWAVIAERNAEKEAAISGMNGTMKSITYLELQFSTDVIAKKHADSLKEFGVFFENPDAVNIDELIDRARNLAQKLNHFAQEYNHD